MWRDGGAHVDAGRPERYVPSVTRPTGESLALREVRSLLELARGVQLTPEELEAQRRAFAYGNARLEDESVTREAVDEAAERLRHRR